MFSCCLILEFLTVLTLILVQSHWKYIYEDYISLNKLFLLPYVLFSELLHFISTALVSL